MNQEMKIGMALIGSFLLLTVGLFRIFSDELKDVPLIVAYILTISGLVGAITNGWKWKQRGD
ncbi:hypothetical protein SAMN05192559_104363 [Halobacillus karajensis]|uniref:Uncharacterized protein n=1 Tax=Halobacillus karajensis TaxID=195088 RepID=A0A024P1D6_9BACI|nr:hypothetical protein [Halobacillus karajensis]CDQ19410.1 hypothetical protein BN982_01704 [Halobacillus karajensis]CDQ21873.1 hypothetical protein BN983_00068 [Halobacillus karajensis]CDQ27713.1 hypothetical protein BN981_01994 [Halobacillus karajensis]SEH82999.1 hypothetical protein SAMN05192559_104363 [Halobacillus karajensis]